MYLCCNLSLLINQKLKSNDKFINYKIIAQYLHLLLKGESIFFINVVYSNWTESDHYTGLSQAFMYNPVSHTDSPKQYPAIQLCS